jgi:hydroxyacylglutathione hydrolase
VTIDVRDVTSFLGGHIPGSYCLPESMISAFAGWFLDADDDLLLVASGVGQAERATRSLYRIGYDRVLGFLTPGLVGWAAKAEPFEVIQAVDVDTVRERISSSLNDWALLDVRDEAEVAGGKIEGAQTIYVGELPQKLDDLDKSRHYTVMCASGARATIAASVLSKSGFEKVDVFLGSMGAWSADAA